MVTALRQEQSSATSGNGTVFKAADARYSSLSEAADGMATKLALSTCGGNGLSRTDKSHITHVISSTAIAGSPSQCTQNYTAAFVRQNWGSMAGCIRNQKQPVGANNPKSVGVSNVKGAGDFATADVVFHFASGKKQNLSVAILNQSGSWRLLAFQTR